MTLDRIRSVFRYLDDDAPRQGAPGEGGPALQTRISAIDGARGLAVLLMVLWHTADGWLVAGAKAGTAFEIIHFGGSHAAPFFVLLAGLAAALRSGADAARGVSPGKTRAALASRGLYLMVAGHLLLYSRWLLDSLAVATPHGLAVLGLVTVGGVLALTALDDPKRPPRQRAAMLAAGVALLALAFVVTSAVAPARARLLFVVDVLHAIGGGLLVSSLVLRLPRAAVAWVAIAIAIAVTLVTPLAARAPLDAYLPAPLIAWIVRPVSGDATRLAAFPLLPWLAYALTGVAVGIALRGRSRKVRAGLLGAAGVTLVLAFHASSPIGHRIAHEAPLLSLALRTASKIGVVLGGVAVLEALPRIRPLEALGRVSLAVYVLHLTFAYGIASRPLRGTTTLTSWLVFSLLLLVVLVLVLHAAKRVRARMMRSRLSPPKALL